MIILILCVIPISLSLIMVNCIPIDYNKEEYEKYDRFNNGLGLSRFSYELPDGTVNEQNVNVIRLGEDSKVIALGKYSYRVQGPIVTNVKYIADDKGYRPRVSISNLQLIKYELPTNAIITLQGGFG